MSLLQRELCEPSSFLRMTCSSYVISDRSILARNAAALAALGDQKATGKKVAKANLYVSLSSPRLFR